jgi:hypothetical protein
MDKEYIDNYVKECLADIHAATVYEKATMAFLSTPACKNTLGPAEECRLNIYYPMRSYFLKHEKCVKQK